MSITLKGLKKGTNAYNNAVKSGRPTGPVTVKSGALPPGRLNAVNGLKTATPVSLAASKPVSVGATAGDVFRANGYTAGSTLNLLDPNVKTATLAATGIATNTQATTPAAKTNTMAEPSNIAPIALGLLALYAVMK